MPSVMAPSDDETRRDRYRSLCCCFVVCHACDLHLTWFCGRVASLMDYLGTGDIESRLQELIDIQDELE